MDRLSNSRSNRVATISSINEVEVSTSDAEAPVDANADMAKEKTTKLFKADQRYQIYKDIWFNQPTIEVSYFVAAYGFAGVVLSCLLTSTIPLIPVHNVIEEPKYWYVGMTG